MSKENYLPSFEKKLKDYPAEAIISLASVRNGTRRHDQKMYGSSIFTDEILKSVEKELYTWLNKERPEIYGQPLPCQRYTKHGYQ